MFITYNSTGVGDVLIVPLKQGKQTERTYETYGDVVKITDAKGNIYGYNIFNASTYLDLKKDGQMLISDQLVSDIEGIFQENNLSDTLDIDTTPKFVVGYVESREQHPDADKLSVCQVDLGDETTQIVCGAANVDAGQKVVVAKVGATMPDGLAIRPTELRGVASNGMICSRVELALPKDPEEQGIYVLDDFAEIGQPFDFK